MEGIDTSNGHAHFQTPSVSTGRAGISFSWTQNTAFSFTDAFIGLLVLLNFDNASPEEPL